MKKFYNRTTHTLSIPSEFKGPLQSIPGDTKKIIFLERDIRGGSLSKFNQPLENLPGFLVELHLGYCFDQELNYLPDTLTHLTFGNKFNQNIDFLQKNENLQYLKLGNAFNHSVIKLPNSITHLTFGIGFNKSVDRLPTKLTHLVFGRNFNKNVDLLPKSLKYLKFGEKFNQPVNYLPENLISVIFGRDFTQCLKNVICSELGFNYNCEIRNNISCICDSLLIDFLDQADDRDFPKLTMQNIPSQICKIKVINTQNLSAQYHDYLSQIPYCVPRYLKKIPFGCIVINENDEEIKI